MAKKTARDIYGLVCTVCKSQNYIVTKNKLNTPTALKLMKYCKKCRTKREHKEAKKID